MAVSRLHNFWHKGIRAAAAFLFMLMSVLPSHAGMVVLPAPGTLLPPSAAFAPASLRAITIDAKDPLRFSFLIDRGTQELPADQKRGEYAQLAKYFLAALTIPDTEQWVNLSPYEGDRLISDQFGMTEMGRDLLAQDYLLKQLTASLMHPDSETGKRFWAAIYDKANKTFGTTDVPLDTFNKVWIIPDNAEVYEKGTSAFLLTQHLQVMTERDYLALRQAQGSSPVENRPAEQNAELTRITSDAVREIIVPAIEKEVNEGQTFAQLRQICSAMILATWYKKALKESFLGQLYADKGKVAGVDQDPKNNEAVFQQYMAAFRKGVVNLIREDYDNYSQELIPRKYFSGGLERDPAQLAVVTDQAMLSERARSAAQHIGEMDQAEIVLHGSDTADAMSTPDLLAGAVKRLMESGERAVVDELIVQGKERSQKFEVRTVSLGSKSGQNVKVLVYPEGGRDADGRGDIFSLNLTVDANARILKVDIGTADMNKAGMSGFYKPIFNALVGNVSITTSQINNIESKNVLNRWIVNDRGGELSSFRELAPSQFAVTLLGRVRGDRIFSVSNPEVMFNISSYRLGLFSSLEETLAGLFAAAREAEQAWWAGDAGDIGLTKEKVAALRVSYSTSRLEVLKSEFESVRARATQISDEHHLILEKALERQIARLDVLAAHSGEQKAVPSVVNNVGGIDLNADNLNMRIKRDGSGVPLHMMQQDLQGLEIRGFVPEVGAITAVPAAAFLSDIK